MRHCRKGRLYSQVITLVLMAHRSISRAISSGFKLSHRLLQPSAAPPAPFTPPSMFNCPMATDAEVGPSLSEAAADLSELTSAS
jgi:hypothetical protein